MTDAYAAKTGSDFDDLLDALAMSARTTNPRPSRPSMTTRISRSLSVSSGRRPHHGMSACFREPDFRAWNDNWLPE